MQGLTIVPPLSQRLRTLLAEGSKPSREVAAVLGAEGYTPKQIRRAREHEDIVIERAGNGRAMRSTWRLSIPVAIPALDEMLTFVGVGDTASQRSASERETETVATKVSTEKAVPCTQRMQPANEPGAASAFEGLGAANLTDFEVQRAERGAIVFVQRGMGINAARDLAIRLVLERDRPAQRATGSCIECQMLVRQECHVTPRPVSEIHECWYRRPDTP